MADVPSGPGPRKTDARRTPLPDVAGRAVVDRARARARVAGETAGTPDDGGIGPEQPDRPMPVLRWKERAGR
jgi:hypothetical protein